MPPANAKHDHSFKKANRIKSGWTGSSGDILRKVQKLDNYGALGIGRQKFRLMVEKV